VPRAPRYEMSLVANERAKLLATYFNGLAIAVMAIGGFAPLVSFPFSGDDRPFWVTMLIVSICIAVSTTLHLLARRVLAGLKE
jgi:Na+/melibiose symporter-like transporter